MVPSSTEQRSSQGVLFKYLILAILVGTFIFISIVEAPLNSTNNYLPAAFTDLLVGERVVAAGSAPTAPPATTPNLRTDSAEAKNDQHLEHNNSDEEKDIQESEVLAPKPEFQPAETGAPTNAPTTATPEEKEIAASPAENVRPTETSTNKTTHALTKEPTRTPTKEPTKLATLAPTLPQTKSQSSIAPKIASSKLIQGENLSGDIPFNIPFPMPRALSFGSKTVELNSKTFGWTFASCGKSTSSDKIQQQCADLVLATERYSEMLFPHGTSVSCTSSNACLSTVVLNVKDSKEGLDVHTDESYELIVNNDGIYLSAVSMYGAMHGLESLSQLVHYNFESNVYEIQHADWIIQDAPRFPHRELLIDSSRHFLPVPVIESAIRAASYTKINILHWHIIDDQSFPWCSDAVPELCREGSFSPDEKYSREELKHLVVFARQHGIRIIPELDVPGHTASWCRGRPDICTAKGDILSPVDDHAKPVIKKLLTELRGIFPDTLIHLGGDEVDESKWFIDIRTRNYLSSHSMRAKDAYLDFVKTTADEAVKLGYRPIVWDDVWHNFGSRLDKKIIVHMWLRNKVSKEAASAGYDVLYSPVYPWYLDNMEMSYANALEREPCETLAGDLCKHALGGGGEMWGEKVDTSNFYNTVWPKLAAISERLWALPTVKVAQIQRGEFFRCHLNRRGIPAAPILNKMPRTAPGGPGSCYNQ